MQMGNCNRATERNRAGRVLIIYPFLVAYHVASYFGRRQRLLLGLEAGLSERRPNLCCRVAGRTSLACFVGALAAAPGSIAMHRASPARFPRASLFASVPRWFAFSFFVERSFSRSVKSSPS
jgi:hypothetical protein